jgi:hypothetical protein
MTRPQRKDVLHIERFPPELKRALHVQAITSGVTLRQLVMDYLNRELALEQQPEVEG